MTISNITILRTFITASLAGIAQNTVLPPFTNRTVLRKNLTLNYLLNSTSPFKFFHNYY